jgi:hypothetical protein
MKRALLDAPTSSICAHSSTAGQQQSNTETFSRGQGILHMCFNHSVSKHADAAKAREFWPPSLSALYVHTGSHHPKPAVFHNEEKSQDDSFLQHLRTHTQTLMKSFSIRESSLAHQFPESLHFHHSPGNQVNYRLPHPFHIHF